MILPAQPTAHHPPHQKTTNSSHLRDAITTAHQSVKIKSLLLALRSTKTQNLNSYTTKRIPYRHE